MTRHAYLAAAAMAVGMCLSGTARAQFMMDGTKDDAYGPALSVQNTQTQFGDAANGDPINGGGGSEIDAVYAKVFNGRLYVMVTGNLETNFNKLEVFIDSEPGVGVNTLDTATNPTMGGGTDDWHNNNSLPGGVDRFCCGGFAPPNGGNAENDGALQRMHGLTFDEGFDADHYITITHGFENALTPNLNFYGASAHYADLTDGVNGRSGALGIQLAQKGLPQVLRGTTADFDVDGNVDGGEFLTWQQNFGTTSGATRAMGNADGGNDGDQGPRDVDGDDFNIWAATFGFNVEAAPFDGFYFVPQTQGVDNSNVLLGPSLPGLSQGDLIDKVYAQGPGTVMGNLITRELEFVLPVVTPDNPESHRDMENIIDLQMAIDNSNALGVSGGAGPADQAAAEAVMTGIEFSVPLSEIGASAESGPIKLMVFINGGEHHYASNQFSGVGVMQGNLGGDGFGNFTGALHDNDSDLSVNMLDYEGDQFVTVANPAVASGGAVPEPTGAALMVVAALGLARRRR